MGIKTKFNPMGGMRKEASELSLWRYSNDIISGKTLLFNYTGSDWVNTIYVPKCNGNSIINDWYNSPSSGTVDTNRNTPFYNNKSVTSVDFQYVPFRNSSAFRAFDNCNSLSAVYNLNSTINRVDMLFANCIKFNYNIQFGWVTSSMSSTFEYCYQLNQNIYLPSNVSNIAFAFRNCHALNQNIYIPSHVYNMQATFQNCITLNQNIKIPDSVVDMVGTFEGCWTLNQSINIPNSVAWARYIFTNCNKLDQNITFGSNIYYMTYAFNGCNSMGKAGRRCITILSNHVYDFTACFNNMGSYSYGQQLAVVFPMRYINNVNTETRDKLVSAGYAVGTGVGNFVMNDTHSVYFHAFDNIGGDYNSYQGNGTHWLLKKWNGNLSETMNDSVITYNVVVNSSYFGYPTAIDPACFKGNTIIQNIDCNGVGFSGTSAALAFNSCTSLHYVTNINIPSGITNLKDMFTSPGASSNIRGVNTGTGRTYGYGMMTNIPNTVTSAHGLFSNAKYLTDIQVGDITHGYGITTVAYLCGWCNTRPVNVRIYSPAVTNITNVFVGYTTTYRKNIWIYFKYKNGVATSTFNKFKTALFMGNTTAVFTNPRFNATSNFYVYNIGVCPV